MIGFAMMFVGYTLVLLCIDLPWPKTFYPRTIGQLFWMAFGGVFLAFLGSLMLVENVR